jgi:tetratricopeptide (TPR) repeat protein
MATIISGVENLLDKVGDLYARGQYLQAYDAGQAWGRLQDWPGTAAQIMAGRLAGNLGAPRLATALHVRAWRNDPSDPEATYFYCLRMPRRGPYEVWRTMRKFGDLADAPAGIRADWYALQGHVAAMLRDFEAAEQYLGRAELIACDRPWLWVERSSVLEIQDRYDEALEAAQEALRLRPWYRPGVMSTAHLLELAGREREALDLLSEAGEQLQSGDVLAQLAGLQTELKHYEDARRTCERLPALFPLAENSYIEYMATMRCDAAYHCGDFVQAQELARQCKSSWHQAIAENMSQATPDARRVLLPVQFVRQHHVTCAPATLTALSAFWSRPADHLQVAAKICYDGTPAHSERNWAEQSGFHAREFSLTWDAATALLDRGLPFTLTTVQACNAHLQATVGYDSRRRTLLIRDPSSPRQGEFLASALFESHRSSGPRGMMLAPHEELTRDGISRLDGLALPDSELYDELHRLNSALERHDRAAAWTAYEAMQKSDPQHRLTWQARRSLAGYDADPINALQACEELLAQFPDDPNLLLSKLAYLRDLARRDDRMALYEHLCANPKTDPIFWVHFAQELADDARNNDRATRLLRRALRYRPLEARSYYFLANILWSERDYETACELYRIAACLDDKDEQFARAYFIATRTVKQVDAALKFLRQRFNRLGSKSGWPARTLFGCLSQLEQMAEAFEFLEKALRLRPDDAELLLYAADAYGRHGKFEQAKAHLAQASGKSHASRWLRAAAGLASYEGDLAGSLNYWRQVLAAEPPAEDANAAVARLLAETAGKEEALLHLDEVVRRFPHNVALLRLRIEWLHDEDPVQSEAAVRQLLEVHPVDPWAHRELAVTLQRALKPEEALAAIDTATALEPSCSYNLSIRGRIHEQLGRLSEARSDYRQALTVSVDNDNALARLVLICDTAAEKRAELEFINHELVRQTTFGDGLIAYRDYAKDVLEPAAILSLLRDACQARPDLWHAWAALVRQLIDMKQLDEAEQLALQSTARFPLLPVAWIDLAQVYRARGDVVHEEEFLHRAREINPSWSVAAQHLAELYERRKDYASSKALLEQAVARNPLDAILRGFLAEAHYRLDEKSAALECLQQAVQLDPSYRWAWDMLKAWGPEVDQAEAALCAARELTVRRPMEARSWHTLARMLDSSEALEERLSALNKAIEINLRYIDAYLDRAECLANAKRFDEAVASCATNAWGDQPPIELRGCRAWIESRRGDYHTAIALMHEVIAVEPNHYNYWKHLTEWYFETEAKEEYLDAAEHRARLAPQDPVSCGYLADARLRNGDRAGAKADFRRAFELSAAYDYAGNRLFDMQLEDGELDEAEASLERLKSETKPDDEFILSREAQLAARKDQLSRAVSALRGLCVHPTEAMWPLFAATEAMRKAGWPETVDREFISALDHTVISPVVYERWVDLCAEDQNWDVCRKQLNRMNGVGEPWRRASARFLEAAGDAELADQVRAFQWKHGKWLANDVRTWGQLGRALTRIGDHAAAVAWLSDWGSRADVQPWMCFFLALSLRHLKRDDEATTVHRRAVEMDADYSKSMHCIWLAADELAQGKRDARRWVVDVKEDDLNEFYKGLLKLVQETADVQAALSEGHAASYSAVRKRLQRVLEPYRPSFEKEPMLQRTWHRLLHRVALDRGHRLAALWHHLRARWMKQ